MYYISFLLFLSLWQYYLLLLSHTCTLFDFDIINDEMAKVTESLCWALEYVKVFTVISSSFSKEREKWRNNPIHLIFVPVSTKCSIREFHWCEVGPCGFHTAVENCPYDQFRIKVTNYLTLKCKNKNVKIKSEKDSLLHLIWGMESWSSL